MVRFTAKNPHSDHFQKPYSDYVDDDANTKTSDAPPNTASKIKKALGAAIGAGRAKRSEYDAAPSSRYDPSTMSRIGIDIHSDSVLDIDEMIDPQFHGGKGGQHGDATFILSGDDLDGLYQAQRMRRRPVYRPSAACRRCLCTTLLFGGVMALVVGITHLLVGYGPNGLSTWLDGHQTPHGTVLPPAPSDLSTICSTEAIGQPGGYQKCEAACVEAECCFLPEGHWFSCRTSEFGAQCASYEADCMVLDGYDSSKGGGGGGNAISVEVPAPPANLDEMCGPASLGTADGYDKCSDGCELARCCSQPIEVCKVTNPKMCSQYEPCAVMLDGDAAGTVTSKISANSHPGAVSTQTQQKCNTAALMDSAGVAGCKSFCDPALCCFSPDGEELDVEMEVSASGGSGGSSTWQSTAIIGCATPDNAGWCGQYSACQSLFTVNGDGYLSDEVASDAVDAACSDMSTDAGMKRCGDMCSPAECCFTSESHCENTGLGDIDCDHYDACYEFFDLRTGPSAQQVLVPRPPASLEPMCEGSKFHTAAGRQMCADACSVAKCCITDIEICKVVNPQMCGAYEIHCAEVWNEPHQEITIPSPPKDLESKCAGVTMSDDKWSQCDDACRPARCCDEDIDVCKVLNPHLCEAYEIHCAIVWGDSYHEVTIPDPPRDLDRNCAGASLSDARRNNCDDACRPAKCCDEDIEACKVLNPDICEAYEVHCAEVWGDAYHEVNVPAAPTELETVCAPGYSTSKDSNRSQCSDLCYMAKCCDEDIDACKVLNPSACDAYEKPCSNFWGDSIEIPLPPSDLEQTCSVESLQTAGGFSDCEQLCDQASCCNKPMSTCRVTNPEICSNWSACSNLFEPIDLSELKGAGVEVSQAPEGLAALCSPNSLSNVRGFNDCEDKCNRARCCLEDPGDCNIKNPDVCPAYIDPCTALYDFKFGGKVEKNTGSIAGTQTTDSVSLMDLAVQVAEACNTDNLMEVQGRQHCQHLCSDRLCCFEKDPKYNCVKEKQNECVAFAACEELINAGPLPAATLPAPSPTRPPPTQAAPTVSKLGLYDGEALSTVCSHEQISTIDGMKKCNDVCAPVLCCWSIDPNINCYDEHWKECDISQNCGFLAKPDNAPKNPGSILMEEVDEACSRAQISSADGLKACHQLCAHRLCCFVAEGMSSSCAADTVGCSDYEACEVLVNQIPSDNVMVEDVDDACAADTIAREGKDECVELCSQRSCCFNDGIGGCYGTDKNWCDEFALCRGIYEYILQITDDSESDDSMDDDDMVEDEVDEICAESKLKTKTGLAICHEVCDPKFCCFDAKETANCYDDDPEGCGNYQGCISLYEYEGIDYKSQLGSEIETLCSPAKLRSSSGKAICQQICQTQASCFNGGAKSKSDQCKQFAACKNLDEYSGYSGVGSASSPPANGGGVCKNVAGLDDNEASRFCCGIGSGSPKVDMAMCKQVCKNTDCCFTKCPGTTSETMLEFCEEFAACEVLHSS